MKNEFIFKHPVDIIGEMHGLVTVPTGYDPAKESLPVIVFLNGAGERGEDVERLKVHSIPMIFSRDPDYHGLRVVTLSPQCPDNMTWYHLAYPLRDWILAAMKEYNGDPARLSITGISLGGYGTWDMLTTFPEMFSCAAPVCGGGHIWRITPALRNKPIRVYHGLDDPIVPFRYATDMVEFARLHGANVDFIAYDKVGHDSWVPAYEETDLIDWMVAQKLPDKE